MKSKKSTVLILVTIIIVVLIICTMFIVRNTIAKEEIKSEVKLSEEERNNLNYEQLIKDIYSVKNGHEVKYAKEQEKSIDTKMEDIVNSNLLYIGEGYTISYKMMPEMKEYDFYINDNKLIYSIHESIPFESTQEHIKRIIDKNKANIIFYGFITVIVIITIVVCIVICKKWKR